MSTYARIRSLPLQNSCLHHHHDYHQLVIATRGCAEFEVAGRGGKVDIINGCLVPAGEVHFYEGIGDNQHLVVDLPSSTVEFGLQRVFDEPRYFEADTTLRLLFAYLQREAELWERLPGAADRALVCLLASVHQRLFDRAGAVRPRGRLDLAKLDMYIREHLHEPLSTADLAHVAHVSAGHFHALFREASGMTPGRYVLLARLEHARSLLRETRLPVDAIAARVGFASQSAFTHAFRRHFGHPPGQMRRLY